MMSSKYLRMLTTEPPNVASAMTPTTKKVTWSNFVDKVVSIAPCDTCVAPCDNCMIKNTTISASMANCPMSMGGFTAGGSGWFSCAVASDVTMLRGVCLQSRVARRVLGRLKCEREIRAHVGGQKRARTRPIAINAACMVTRLRRVCRESETR